MSKNKLLLLLVLLLTAATGAWAQEPATTYSVKMKDGTQDAKNWSIASGEKSAKGDAADGLTGLKEKDAVTLTYSGRLKVKGVKATSDAAAAEESDLLSGVFSVSSTKKVNFSKGNLQATYNGTDWTWAFAKNQWDYIGNAAGNTSVNGNGTVSASNVTVDLFGWVGASSTWTGAAQYGISNSTATDNTDGYGNVAREALKSDWGNTIGTGWFTLSSDEWQYLFNTRTTGGTVFGTEQARYAQATINTDGTSVKGMILFPDGVSIASTEVTTAGSVNATSAYATKCTTAQWAALAAKGCVFLPAAGNRNEASVYSADSGGYYWSSSPNTSNVYYAYRVIFLSGNLSLTTHTSRYLGYSVRLVKATSDAAAAAKEPATVTTAPTGAAIVGAGKTTALVSGGVADGGTLMYAVTTTNTKPASTAGFSDAVPTAKDISASGKVYVWYYVKADDTHSDSEIAATAIEVPVADIVWDGTNVSDLYVSGTYASYEKEGVTLSGNADQLQVMWFDYGDPTMDGMAFDLNESGGFTFTAPTGKAFTKIEMKAQGPGGWDFANLGSGWAFDFDDMNMIYTVTWKGNSAASTVDLLKDADEFPGESISYIAFYLSE